MTVATATDTLDGVIFILTERCNSRCTTCDYWLIDEPATLDAGDVESFWVGHVATRPRFVTLTGGEPLLYSDLFRLARFLGPRTESLVLSTNGIRLARYALHVAEHFDKVIVSLDGARPETVRAIRGVDEYDRVMDGVVRLCTAPVGPAIILKMVIQRRNFTELPGFLSLARRLGVDGIALAIPDVSSDGFIREEDRRVTKTPELLLTGDESKAFDDIVRAVERDHADDLVPGYLLEGNLDRFVTVFRHRAGVGPPPPLRSCPVATSRLIVTAAGDILPCFFRAPIGTIRDAPQGDFFSSPAAVVLRDGFDPGSNEACLKCEQFLDWRFR